MTNFKVGEQVTIKGLPGIWKILEIQIGDMAVLSDSGGVCQVRLSTLELEHPKSVRIKKKLYIAIKEYPSHEGLHMAGYAYPRRESAAAFWNEPHQVVEVEIEVDSEV